MELLWPTTFQPHVKLPLQIWGILRLIKTRDYLFRFRHLSKSVCRNPVLVAPFTHCQLFQTTLRDLFLPFYHRHETSTLKPIFHFSRFVKSLFHSISYSGSDILYGNKNNDGQNLWIIGEPLVNCNAGYVVVSKFGPVGVQFCTHNEPSQQNPLKFKLAQRANFKSAMTTKLKSRERSKTSHSGVQGNDFEGEISKR